MNDIVISEYSGHHRGTACRYDLPQSFSDFTPSDVGGLADFCDRLCRPFLINHTHSLGWELSDRASPVTILYAMPAKEPAPYVSEDYLKACGEVYKTLRDLRARQEEELYFREVIGFAMSPATMGSVQLPAEDTHSLPLSRASPINS